MKPSLLVVASALVIPCAVTTARAAFVVEADNAAPQGKAFDHFISTPPGSGFQLSAFPSNAVGLAGNQSAFGNPANATGPDRYELFYTPGPDGDNTPFFTGLALGNSSASDIDGAGPALPNYNIAPHFASGLTGGLTGLYNVYFTSPSTQNVNPLGSTITINSDAAPIVLNPVVMNDGGTGPDESPAGSFTGGANNRWLHLGAVPLTAGNTYAVVIEANANPPDLVSQRTHGVMWEYLGPMPPPGGNELEPNDTIATAQNIDGLFTLDFSADVGNTVANTSTQIPHASVNGTGNGTFDYYSFTVANAGDIGIFDVDYTTGLDSHLQLYTGAGDLLGGNDDSSGSFGQGGSATSLDSYLEHTFAAPGSYVIEVGSCCVSTTPPGTSYQLQVSVGANPPPPAPVVLDNGSLRVAISDSNGAINQVLFSGSDYYNPGTPVSNWGLQVGTDTTTFATNTADGISGIPVSVDIVDDSAVVTGNYSTAGGVDIDLTRTYSLVPGLNVLRITTEFVNNGVDTVVSYFDTFDPDQGNLGGALETYNDVFTTLAGAATVGQATEFNGLSVAMGSLDPLATVASGSPFAIAGGSEVNDFFAAPFDGNGAFTDQGTHVGTRRFLAAGQSFTFTYEQAYGLSASQALNQFLAANVPEPSTIVLASSWCILSLIKRRRTSR